MLVLPEWLPLGAILILLFLLGSGFLMVRRAKGRLPSSKERRRSEPSHPLLRVRPKPEPFLDDLLEVDDVLQDLPVGNVAFNSPNTMTLKKIYPIYVLLSPEKSIEELQRDLQRRIEDHQLFEGAQIRIASEMEARLTGQNFEITAVAPESQAISGQEQTEWQWDVKPKEEGTQELHLTLSAILYVNDRAIPRAIRTFDKKITVQVTLGQRIGAFIRDNWDKIWKVLLVPLALLIWKNWRGIVEFLRHFFHR